MTKQVKSITRRQAIFGAGAATTVIGLGSLASPSSAADKSWNHTADIVIVGTGIGAATAAITAHDQGNKVIIIEKSPMFGGTSAKTAGVIWSPNNYTLKARGMKDSKKDCLEYLARFSYPEHFNADAENLGLTEHAYSLLEAFYDNSSDSIDSLRKAKALNTAEWRMFAMDVAATDYLDNVPENKTPAGRALGVVTPEGTIGSGLDMMEQMQEAVEKRKIKVLMEHQVVKVIQDDSGRVIGVESKSDDTSVTVKASKGVIFGSGGYIHNTKAVASYQRNHVYGACAIPMSTGDFIDIARKAGAQIGNLFGAWRTQVVLEEALDYRYLAGGVFYPSGDSAIQVNKYGVRSVNEQRNYNDRTEIHGTYDPSKAEQGNQLMFMVYDQRSAEAFAGAYPIPAAGADNPFVLSADSIDGLTKKIDARLKKLAKQTGNVQLDAKFAEQLGKTIERYNSFAVAGKDEDFQRGDAAYDTEWFGAFSPLQASSGHKSSPYPKINMHPLNNDGPYYAIILGAGALDTNGGPVINAEAQVLDTDGNPIAGLYGAGNCIASPSRDAYWGAGCPLGLSSTFGYIAANAANKAK